MAEDKSKTHSDTKSSDKPKAKKAATPTESKKAAPRQAKGDKPAEASAKKAKGGQSAKRSQLNPRTFYPKQGELSKWRVVDAKGIPLGRLSSHIAMLLMGKDKPSFTRFADTGDFVIVVNAKEVMLTGKKWEDKTYHYHTNYPGGIKTFTAKELLEKRPERLIRWAVYGMLPKGHMGRRWYKKLRVFAGPEHPHKAQTPQPVKLPNLGTYAV